MAKMIPRFVSTDTESSAEIRMFDLLKDQLPSNWIVLHSLHLSAARHTRSGETDFTVISPCGVFCLEAKTGTVRVKDGEWFSDPGGSNPDKNPFEQSFSASAAVHKFLEETQPIQRGVLTGSGVLLPDVFFDISSIEVNPALVYDLSSRRAGLLKYLESIAHYWLIERAAFGENIRNNPYSGPEMEAIAKALRPNFDLRIPLTAELEVVQEQLIGLTDDQYDLLDQIDFGLNPRLMVEGGAGSGKTLCAIEIAKSQSRAGIDQHIRVHDLRHTAASLMIENGVRPDRVQNVLGHSSYTTTMDTYVHPNPETLRDAVNILGDAITG